MRGFLFVDAFLPSTEACHHRVRTTKFLLPYVIWGMVGAIVAYQRMTPMYKGQRDFGGLGLRFGLVTPIIIGWSGYSLAQYTPVLRIIDWRLTR